MVRKSWLLMVIGVLLLNGAPCVADGDFYVIAVGSGVGTKITALPYTITAPGFYYVAGNLTCAAGNGITVNAHDVTIDLMGFCLTGPGALGLDHGIHMSGKQNVEIRNGTLRSWFRGISEGSASGSTRVINVRAADTNTGMRVYGLDSLVKGCTVQNFDTGIVMNSGTISGNLAEGGTIGISQSGGIVNANVVRNCTETGIIKVSGGPVTANYVHNCGLVFWPNLI